MDLEQEKRLKELLFRYDRKIFVFSMYLLQGSRDRAYDIATSCFAEVARNSIDPKKAIPSLVRAVLKMGREVNTVPSADAEDFERMKPSEKNMLIYVRRVLQSLSFEAKATVLLRDQMNLGYREMAEIFQTSQDKIKHRTLEARKEIRTNLQEVLREAR